LDGRFVVIHRLNFGEHLVESLLEGFDTFFHFDTALNGRGDTRGAEKQLARLFKIGYGDLMLTRMHAIWNQTSTTRSQRNDPHLRRKVCDTRHKPCSVIILLVNCIAANVHA
jgi:hypothetical protein